MSADRKTAKEVLLDVIAQNSKKITELQQENVQCEAAIKIIDGISSSATIAKPYIRVQIKSDEIAGQTYDIELFRARPFDTCTCRDFTIRRQRQTPCKHIDRARRLHYVPSA